MAGFVLTIFNGENGTNCFQFCFFKHLLFVVVFVVVIVVALCFSFKIYTFDCCSEENAHLNQTKILFKILTIFWSILGTSAFHSVQLFFIRNAMCFDLFEIFLNGEIRINVFSFSNTDFFFSSVLFKFCLLVGAPDFPFFCPTYVLILFIFFSFFLLRFVSLHLFLTCFYVVSSENNKSTRDDDVKCS